MMRRFSVFGSGMSMGRGVLKVIHDAIFAACLLIVSALSQADVRITPAAIYTGNEIRVLQPGPNLHAILANITDASSSNPYRIHLGPGVYDVTSQLQMKPFVDIIGSGENNTIITASITGSFTTGAVVRLALNSTLSHVTVENTESVGVINVAITSDSLDSSGDASTAKLSHVTARSGGSPSSSARGVHMENSSISLSHVTVEVDGSTTNYGVRSYNSAPHMQDVASTVSGGTANRAFYTSVSGATPTLINTVAKATGTASYGHYLTNGAKPSILRSSMSGVTDAVYAESGTEAIIAQSLLEGGISGTGAYACVANTDENGDPLGANCM